jgi:hypothetical protein
MRTPTEIDPVAPIPLFGEMTICRRLFEMARTEWHHAVVVVDVRLVAEDRDAELRLT